MTERDQPHESRVGEVSVILILTALLFLGSLFIFALLAHEVVLEKEEVFDNRAYAFLQQFSSPGLISFMKTVTFFGNSTFLFPAYAVLIAWLLLRKEKRWAINIGIIGITSTAMLHLLKNIFKRERPGLPLLDTLHNYSFPSGHALSSFIFSSILIYLLLESHQHKAWKWTGSIFLLCFSLCIGLSRIFLRYHYASDVIAGFCLGLAWVQISLWLQNRIHKRLVEKRLQKGRVKNAEDARI